MKAFKKVLLVLFVALFLVPFKNVFAETTYPTSSIYDNNKYWIEFTNKSTGAKGVVRTVEKVTMQQYDGNWEIKNLGSVTNSWSRWHETVINNGQWALYGSGTTNIGSASGIGLDNINWYVTSANYDVQYTGGGSVVAPNPISLTIIQPNATYKDTTSSFNMTVYYKYPVGTIFSQIDIDIACNTINSADWKEERHEYNPTTGEGILTVVANNVPVGEHTITVTSGNITAYRVYQRLEGIVDENGDGIDDRTNQPVDDGHVQYPDTGSTFDGMIDALKNSPKYFEGIIKLFTEMTSWLPTEVKVILILATTVIFAIIIKRVVL